MDETKAAQHEAAITAAAGALSSSIDAAIADGMPPGEAQEHLLRALGVPDEMLPMLASLAAMGQPSG